MSGPQPLSRSHPSAVPSGIATEMPVMPSSACMIALPMAVFKRLTADASVTTDESFCASVYVVRIMPAHSSA